MQLKLRVGLTDTLTIDVQPSDTFQDLSDRLYSLGGVRVDLSQLQKSQDKPFDMSTNVIDYFLPPTGKGNQLNKESDDGFVPQSEVENGRKPKRLCRLCCSPISDNPCFLFDERKDESVTLVEKVNSTLPLCVTKRDHLPKQICEGCFFKINRGFDFMRQVVNAQNTLQQVYNIKPRDRPATNYSEDAWCPLCSAGRFKPRKPRELDWKDESQGTPARSFRSESTTGGVGRPRQQRLPSSAAGNPPVRIKEEPMDTDYYEDDDGRVSNVALAGGYWDQDGNFSTRRRRKKTDEDHEWTIDEEYVPVNRRGRPRGTRNKPKVQVPVVEKHCLLCGWSGPDSDVYAHAICQHCQPDMGYFPCPLCKSHLENEMELENHIDEHVSQGRNMIGVH